MKNHLTALLLVLSMGFMTGGCSLFHHHEAKSSFKIIPVGDKNPSIKDAPYVQKDTPTTTVEVDSGPVDAQ